MKRKLVMICLLSAFVILLFAAGYLYRRLSQQYVPVSAEPSEVIPEAEEENPETHLAPDFTVRDENGENVSLSDQRGKPVAINFWASWCPPCKSELPAFDQAAKDYPDITFMMVDLTDGSRETQTIARAFLLDNGYTFPVYYDLDLDAVYSYQIYSIPLTVFVDAEGVLVNSHIGAMSEETLRQYLDQLLT